MDYAKLLIFFVSIVSVTVLNASPIKRIIDFDDDDDFDDRRSLSKIDTDDFLLKCDPCIPGWGVKSLCNSTSNTVCTPCPSGYWSPKSSHFRPCTPCSKCGDGLYEDLPCTNTRDTKCDSCLNTKGHFNEDYKRKCDWRRVPESMKNTDDWNEDDDEDYEDDSNLKKGGKIKLITLNEKNSKEVDLELDDPEIDDDLVKSKKIDNGKKIDSSEEEIDSDEKIDTGKKIDNGNEDDDTVQVNAFVGWAKVIEARRRALERISKLSQTLEKLSSRRHVGDSDEDDDDVEDDEKPKRVQILRPLPQRVAGKDSPFKGSFWAEDPVRPVEDKRLEINYPPSYHSYPIDSMMHTHRRKAYILMGLTCIMVVSAVVFILCYARSYRKRRSAEYNRIHVVNLSSEEREIVRQSATRIPHSEKPVKKFHFGLGGAGYKQLVNADSQPSLVVTENPLESYLNGEDQRQIVQNVQNSKS